MRNTAAAAALTVLTLAGCAAPTRPPPLSDWVFGPGQDATTFARDTEECERFIATMIPGLKAAQERKVGNLEFAYALVTAPIAFLGGLDSAVNHAALVVAQKIRGPRPWTDEDEQAFRTHRMRGCLRLRGYRDTPLAAEDRR